MMQVGGVHVDVRKGFMGMPVTMTSINERNLHRANVIVMFVWVRMSVDVFHHLV
jgi:hypothetical protein